MEPRYLWTRFVQFVKESLSNKFKAFFPGCLVGLFSAKSLLFAGLPSEVVTVGAFLAKFVATMVMSFGSGLATSYAAYRFDKFKNKKNEPKPPKRSRKKAA